MSQVFSMCAVKERYIMCMSTFSLIANIVQNAIVEDGNHSDLRKW